MSAAQNPREAYGQTLLALAESDHRVVALDADLSKSTKGCMIEEHFPERHFEMSIAEQNMVSVGIGLALSGKIPFVHSFAVFLVGRAYDQIRVGAALGRANIKLVGSSGGLSDFADGATHQTIEDVTLMRSLPNMTVIVPCDAVETAKAAKTIAKYEGPVYLRICRNDIPIIFPETEEFSIGKVTAIREGKDVTIFANGIMVSQSIQASNMLALEGISASVINVSTVKPLDREAIVSHAKKTAAVVVAEEQTIIGGLGSAVAEALIGVSAVPMALVGINDRFGQSACTYEDLLKEYGLTPEAVASACRKVLQTKGERR